MSSRARLIRLLVLVVLMAGSMYSVARSQTDGYSFSGIRVVGVDQETDEALIEYDLAWESPASYPGFRRCTWEVKDGAGFVLGTATSALNGLANAYEDSTVLVRLDSGEAYERHDLHASVACQPGRLDPPAGRYVVTNPRAERAPEFEGDLRSFLVTFDQRWEGGGKPGVQACDAIIRSRGPETAIHEFDLYVDGSVPPQIEMRVILDEEFTSDPDGVTIRCVPYTAANK